MQPPAVDLTTAPVAYPDAIDTRLVLRMYAGLAIAVGLFSYLWPRWAEGFLPTVDGVAWGGFGIFRTAAAVVVGAGLCGLAIATIDDPGVRRRTLVRYATAHVVVGALWLLQWWAIFDGSLPAPVGWLPLIVGVVLLYVGLTAATGTRPRRSTMTYGSLHLHDREAWSGRVWRSQYEDHIRRAAQQEERTRLARDLHDAVKQQLFVVQTAAATAETRLGHDDAGARQAIEQIRSAARDATTEMQAMIEQLQAAPVENVGLVEALRKQSEALGFRTGADVRLRIGELPPPETLPPGAQQALFRAAQEALANIGRHARASHVEVVLEKASERLELSISDDGVGFEPAAAPRGMGIQNMMARARELGAWFSLQSRPGQGTTIQIAVPFSTVSPWQYGRLALAYAALLAVMLVTWRGHGFDPVAVISAALGAVLVIRNVVAVLRVRRRKASA